VPLRDITVERLRGSSVEVAAILGATASTIAGYPGWEVGGHDVTHARDVDLAKRAARGNAEAEAELLRRVLPPLRAVARAILGTTADADDGVQLGLLRVLDKLGSYRGEASLERWCRTVAVRVCLRLSAQNRRHAHGIDPEDEGIGLVAESSTTGLPIDSAIAADIEHYLGRISESQREALVLHHALDYSVPEIAELVGVPVDTVKSRLAFGRRALRRLIQRDLTVAESPRAKRGAHGGG
jgi:RNA polymerase sigma-70 factor, ECF subfamily